MNINENTVLPGFIAWLICSCNLGSESGFEDDEHHGQQEKHDSEQERYMGGNSADEDDELAKKTR